MKFKNMTCDKDVVNPSTSISPVGVYTRLILPLATSRVYSHVIYIDVFNSRILFKCEVVEEQSSEGGRECDGEIRDRRKVIALNTVRNYPYFSCKKLSILTLF